MIDITPYVIIAGMLLLLWMVADSVRLHMKLTRLIRLGEKILRDEREAGGDE